jgi:putative transposase
MQDASNRQQEVVMPRTRRLDLAGLTQHVIQRGNDRQPCFFREIDYIRYLQDLRDSAFSCECSIHAYVLMTNHVHLLVTPRQPGALARMMQSVGRRYVRFVNDALERTGTLWEGRFKSCLVDSERYLLACQRYIELNPVRAAVANDADDYRWSSYAANAWGRYDPLVSPHPVFMALASGSDERHRRYRELVAQGIEPSELTAIRLYVQRQRALGTGSFQAAVERQLERRAGLGKPGRPRTRGCPGSKAGGGADDQRAEPASKGAAEKVL